MSRAKKVASQKHFNKLTPEEAEALALLAEECAEVIQIVMKIQRHGLLSHHPADQFKSNRDLLHKEIGDVMAALRICEVQKIVEWARAIGWRDTKMQKVQKYLHHASVFEGPDPRYVVGRRRQA